MPASCGRKKKGKGTEDLNLVVDANISGYAVNTLKSAEHEVLWMADLSGDKTDKEALEYARKRDAVFVTADADFGENWIDATKPHPPIVRLVGVPPLMQGEALKTLVELQGDRLVPGVVLTGGKNVDD